MPIILSHLKVLILLLSHYNQRRKIIKMTKSILLLDFASAETPRDIPQNSSIEKENYKRTSGTKGAPGSQPTPRFQAYTHQNNSAATIRSPGKC
jgi:hypothetical protein